MKRKHRNDTEFTRISLRIVRGPKFDYIGYFVDKQAHQIAGILKWVRVAHFSYLWNHKVGNIAASLILNLVVFLGFGLKFYNISSI